MRSNPKMPTDDEMLLDFPRRSRTPGWFLRVQEVSAGHYIVTARNRRGIEVSVSGGAPDLPQMIEHCESYAAAHS